MHFKSTNILEKLDSFNPLQEQGRVYKVNSTSMQGVLHTSKIGDFVQVRSIAEGKKLRAQVISVDSNKVHLSLFGNSYGFSAEDIVTTEHTAASLQVGNQLLGSVLNSMGDHICSLLPCRCPSQDFSKEQIPLHSEPPKLRQRYAITKQLITGIRAIDAFTPIGYGQRMSLFAEPGVGKSTLVKSLAHSAKVDVNVIGLIGERAREIAEMIESGLPDATRKKTVLVVSSSSEAPLARMQAAHTATRVAEYFREQGADVLLQIDSLTRLFRAYREVGLAAGELPIRRGYPASVYSRIPDLLERAGCTKQGTISAIYTLLLSSDIDEDPMVEEVKGLTDGHILLSRKIAERARFPAIDIRSSVSRSAQEICSAAHIEHRRIILKKLAEIDEQEEIVLMGTDLGESYQVGQLWKKKLEEFLSEKAMILSENRIEEILSDFAKTAEQF